MIIAVSSANFHRIRKIANDFFKKSGEPGELNWDCFRDYWDMMFDSNQGFILADEADGIFTAVIGVQFYIEPLTGAINASECFWYSDGGNAVALLKPAEQLAKAYGATVMYMNHTAHLTPDTIHKLYKRKGYALSFYRYRKEF